MDQINNVKKMVEGGQSISCVYCGRPLKHRPVGQPADLLLGNPFQMDETKNGTDRDDVCDQHISDYTAPKNDVLREKLCNYVVELLETQRQAIQETGEGSVTLACHCAPLRCHCDAIANELTKDLKLTFGDTLEVEIQYSYDLKAEHLCQPH